MAEQKVTEAGKAAGDAGDKENKGCDFYSMTGTCVVINVIRMLVFRFSHFY